MHFPESSSRRVNGIEHVERLVAQDLERRIGRERFGERGRPIRVDRVIVQAQLAERVVAAGTERLAERLRGDEADRVPGQDERLHGPVRLERRRELFRAVIADFVVREIQDFDGRVRRQARGELLHAHARRDIVSKAHAGPGEDELLRLARRPTDGLAERVRSLDAEWVGAPDFWIQAQIALLVGHEHDRGVDRAAADELA